MLCFGAHKLCPRTPSTLTPPGAALGDTGCGAAPSVPQPGASGPGTSAQPAFSRPRGERCHPFQKPASHAFGACQSCSQAKAKTVTTPPPVSSTSRRAYEPSVSSGNPHIAYALVVGGMSGELTSLHVNVTSGAVLLKVPVPDYNNWGLATRDFAWDPKRVLFYALDVNFTGASGASRPDSGRPITLSKIDPVTGKGVARPKRCHRLCDRLRTILRLVAFMPLPGLTPLPMATKLPNRPAQPFSLSIQTLARSKFKAHCRSVARRVIQPRTGGTTVSGRCR